MVLNMIHISCTKRFYLSVVLLGFDAFLFMNGNDTNANGIFIESPYEIMNVVHTCTYLSFALILESLI